MAPFIRCATLDGYVELALSLGLDPARQAARVGLDVTDFAVPDRWIPAPPAVRLVENSAADSGAEDFGLLLAERRRLATLGPLSVVLREEPDLGSALRLLVRYEYSYNEALLLRLTEAGGLAAFRIDLDLGAAAPTRQALELGVAAFVGIIRQLVGPGWQAEEVCFSHGPPEHLRTHHRLLGPRLRFDAGFTGLVFAAGELTDPNVLADPLLRPYRPQLLQVVPPPRARSTADQVRELVETLLPVGRHSMRQVARALGLTSRTLGRRLAQEHQQFSSIVDDTRAAMAQRYLTADRLSLTDISYQLGFAAPSAFSRWFRHRFGTSPSRWRQEAQERALGAPGRPLPRPREAQPSASASVS
jgi:AraC-like DNA-binding protein